MVDLRKLLPMLLACLALGAVGAGCGGDDDEDSGGSSPAPAEEPSGGSEAESGSSSGGKAAKAVKVDIKDTTFVPMDVSVAKGGTITWTNSDSFAHTVTKEAGPGAEFDSGNLDGGGNFEQKFAAVGKIDYLCEIHPGQTGTISVE